MTMRELNPATFKVSKYGYLYAEDSESKKIMLHPNPSLNEGLIEAFVSDKLEVVTVKYTDPDKKKQAEKIMETASRATFFAIQPRALMEHKKKEYREFAKPDKYMTVFTLERAKSPYVILVIDKDVYVAKSIKEEADYYSYHRNLIREKDPDFHPIEQYEFSINDCYLWNVLLRKDALEEKTRISNPNADYYQHILAALVYPREDLIDRSSIASLIYNYNNDLSDIGLMLMLFPLIKIGHEIAHSEMINYVVDGYRIEEKPLIEF